MESLIKENEKKLSIIYIFHSFHFIKKPSKKKKFLLITNYPSKAKRNN